MKTKQSYNRHNYRVFLVVCLALVMINLPLSLLTNDKYNEQLIALNISKTVNIIYFFNNSKKLQAADSTRILSAVNNEKMHLRFSDTPMYNTQIGNNVCRKNHLCKISQSELRTILKKVNFADPSPPIQFSFYIAPANDWLNFSFERMHYPLASILTAILQLAILFIILTYLLSIQRFIRPWRKIVWMSRKVGLQLTRTKTPFFGPTIIKESIYLMEAMVKRIDQLIQERIATIAALSHDIRTPLTRVKFYAEKIQQPELKQLFRKQVDEIQYLLEETLSYARQDYQDEPKRRLDLNSLVEALCHDMAEIEQHVIFESNATEFIITGQRIGLKRAISNLIENGIKYGDSVIVTVSYDAADLQISIIDKGKGLPEEAFKTVLEPFGRYTKNHDKKISGTGLGLTIAKNLIENNGGTLTIRNHEKYGLEVRLKFSNKGKSK